MKYIADLHVHSCYSMATSKVANPEGYYQWGQIKGINVIGTGDFTHPGYFAEIKEKLKPEGNGFFKLKNPPVTSSNPDIKFCLSAEISSIYKKQDKTRKVHSVIFAPSIEAAAKIRTRLEKIGNIHSDGRPILGLDPKNLLELLLEVSEEAYLIPAHIWTPWFSLFGSKSGFDDIQTCFEELTPYIFALETGLSSDPEMNWRWSSLDRYTLVSNSDAHSPQKLGREANLFDTELSYQGMFNALKTREGFLGTLEFFPEEGKYHLDGHRKCGICLDPEETRKLNNLCPQCGKMLTIGVMHRVLELADREKGKKPRTAKGFRYIIPLPEIIGEITGKGSASKTVEAAYHSLISMFGDEFTLLLDTPLEEISRKAGAVYKEAIQRMRSGLIHPVPGYDGEFGIIRVFLEGEAEKFLGQDKLFAFNTVQKTQTRAHEKKQLSKKSTQPAVAQKKNSLNSEQAAVLELHSGAVLIKAGPGTGKTRTLLAWIESLLLAGKAAPGEILAITFTNKAAREITARLSRLTQEQDLFTRAEQQKCLPAITTFHSFCYDLLKEQNPGINLICDSRKRFALLTHLLKNETPKTVHRANQALESHFENPHLTLDPEWTTVKENYLKLLKRIDAVDLSRLITGVNELLAADPAFLALIRDRYKYIAVDELQDINREQFTLLSQLGAGHCLLAIGDPDQAIYGFRGSEVSLFFRFKTEFAARELSLAANYRSTGTILSAAREVIRHNRTGSGLVQQAERKAGEPIRLVTAAFIEQEARFLITEIEHLVGGLSMNAAHAETGYDEHTYAFSDIAVLFRTKETGRALAPFLIKAGIPIGMREQTPLLEQEPYTLLNSIISVMLNENDFPALLDALMTVYGENAADLKAFFKEQVASDLEFRAYLARAHALELLPVPLYTQLTAFLAFLDELKNILAAGGIPAVLETVFTRYIEPMYGEENRYELDCISGLSRSFGTDLGSFYKQIILNPNESEYPYRTDKVNFLTFHACKGLEFPVVFVTGAEEGITPLNRPGTDLEEERRLFYVAMTRAMDKLCILRLEQRKVFGKLESRQPSRFLQELPAAACKPLVFRPERNKEEYKQQLLF